MTTYDIATGIYTPPQDASTAPVIVGPWPTYDHFKDLPKRERWVLYGSAKAYREALESQGFVMSESYHDFIRRVTRELDL